MTIAKPQHTALIALPLLYVFILVLRIFFDEATVINLESDNLFYDAKLVTDGLLPFRDFLAREPVTLYFYAAQIALFGVHVKLIAVSLAVAKAVALYFFGRTIFQLTRLFPVTVIAMAAMVFFGMKGLPDLFLYFSLWMMVGWHDDRKWWKIFCAGAALGLAVMTYRAVVPFGIVGMILIAYDTLHLQERTLKQIVIAWIGFAAGFGLTLLLPLFYFVWKTDWLWMSDLFIADQLVFAYLFSMLAGIVLYFFFRSLRQAPHRLAWLVPAITVGLIGLFFYKSHPSLAVKIAVLHDFSRAETWVLIPFLLFVVLSTIHFFGTRAPWMRWLCWSVFVSALVIFVIGAFHTSRGPSVALLPWGRVIFIALLLLTVGIWFIVIHRQQWTNAVIGQWQFLFIAFPAVVLFSASLTYSDWLPSYVHNYSFSIVAGASVLFYSVWKQRDVFSFVAGSMVVIGFVVSGSILPQFTREFRGLNASVEMRARHAQATIEYIRQHTGPDEEIFTAVPFFALRSGRPLALHLTHPVVYIPRVDDPKTYDPYQVIPSLTQIQEYLEVHQVRYIIQDERTRSLFHSDRHPALAAYITDHYKKVESYGNIKILKRE